MIDTDKLGYIRKPYFPHASSGCRATHLQEFKVHFAAVACASLHTLPYLRNKPVASMPDPGAAKWRSKWRQSYGRAANAQEEFHFRRRLQAASTYLRAKLLHG